MRGSASSADKDHPITVDPNNGAYCFGPFALEGSKRIPRPAAGTTAHTRRNAGLTERER